MLGGAELSGCSEDVKEMVLLLMAYFDKREVKSRVMFQTNKLPLTPTIIGCGKWIFLCALLLMYG